MTDFTPEFIQTELAKAAKATPRPYEKFDRFIRYKVEDSQGYQEWMPYNQHYRNGTAEDDADWLVAAANHYEEALREIERLKEQGYMAMEARGWEAAAAVIMDYLDEK